MPDGPVLDDPTMAGHFSAFVNRTITMGRFVAPSAVARAV